MSEAAMRIVEMVADEAGKFSEDETESIRIGAMIGSAVIGTQYKVIYERHGNETAQLWISTVLDSVSGFIGKTLKKKMKIMIVEVD